MSTWDERRQGLGFGIQTGLNRNPKLVWARKHKKTRGCISLFRGAKWELKFYTSILCKVMIEIDLS